jgi:hypothetical protein
MALARRNLPYHRRHGCGGVSSAVAVYRHYTELPPCDVEAINNSFWEPYMALLWLSSIQWMYPRPHSGYPVSELVTSAAPASMAEGKGRYMPSSGGRRRQFMDDLDRRPVFTARR